jgi:hypothetical protein
MTTPEYQLRLYVAGQTPKSLAALANLKKICEENLKGRYSIEVIDLMQNPHLARKDQVIAIPTFPGPSRSYRPPVGQIRPAWAVVWALALAWEARASAGPVSAARACSSPA